MDPLSPLASPGKSKPMLGEYRETEAEEKLS